jgi:hypothetical protein
MDPTLHLTRSRRSQSRAAIAVVVLAVELVGCGVSRDDPPLAPAALSKPQTEALMRMNAAGARQFAGWTWHYDFGQGCTLRIRKHFENEKVPVVTHLLQGHSVDITAYASAGFGVKAYPPSGKGGNADIFDARSLGEATAFGRDLTLLIESCNAMTSKPTGA